MNKVLQNFFFVILIFLLISSLFALFNPQIFEKPEEISFSQVSREINEGNIKEVIVFGDDLLILYQDESQAISRKEPDSSLTESLINYGVPQEKIRGLQIKIEEEKGSIWEWVMPLLIFLPILIFVWFFWMLSKQAKIGASQTFGFLKAPAKLFGGGKTPGEKVTFKDIAGLEEAKEEVKEVVDFLKNPKKFWKMGARIPRGVLLIGPPGCGKTLMARAVANESNVPFFSIVGSAFVELFVGVGSARVRSLFETAKKNQPSILFIDEIDAIGKVRMPGFGGGHEEREQTLNQILAEMDGFERDTGVIVIGATNKPGFLDPALLRPGRFDRRIVLDLPDIKGRKEILKIHCRDKPLALGVNLDEVAERTPGFSGADLANLVNEAAILAARRNKKQIYQEEFLESIEKVLLGPERKSHLLSKKEKEISAFHEAGHALVSASIPEAEEVRKISIVSRGMTAGYTLALPKQEKRIKTKSEFLAELSVLLGGFCAEKLRFKEISTGATNDLEKVSFLARNLVTKYGMSKLGPVSFGKRESLLFLDWEAEAERNYSEKIAAAIDKEIERFIKEAEKKTARILKKRRKILERIAKVLIEKETIEKEEFENLVKKKVKIKKVKK
ncbi:cell division protein FtsH [bacterium (Candidatus Gribaldobacteria) CG_4_10_14_0_2_um_filter_36_18]|uniref:ATP-dependent zinc metalloprotease FtsH n=1 Tax=bacterium (Candidatus Gribaldobacteria) CG_4_10_14_0_2_um_filter_36_18 TaxID=2014264 RepID=A0A2M7VL08_9BACT|nr:MAG: cell division protein FtsH [bacterium (Candidatus Gribaldobacteria) CG_4_10_14_0_2_um_filter_36_18]